MKIMRLFREFNHVWFDFNFVGEYLGSGLAFQVFLSLQMGSRRGVTAKVLDCGQEVNEFELQSLYYVHFWTNILGKGMNPLIPPANG